MLRLMTTGATGAQKPSTKYRNIFGALLTTMLFATVGLPGATPQQAQASKIGPDAPANYDNRYEVYGGLSFMNFQAGQNLPTRMNMGGGEVEGTYWLSGSSTWRTHLGGTGDSRFEAGPPPTFPSPASVNPQRELVRMNIGMAGVQWRGPRNHYAALNYHALAGVGAGDFSKAFYNGQQINVGLYNSTIKPMGVAG